jgi:hypothetical protein
VIPIADVSIGLQILYVVMMYISVYPVVIAMRHSNVLEQQSLGVYSTNEMDARHDSHDRTAIVPWMIIGRRADRQKRPWAADSESGAAATCLQGSTRCSCAIQVHHHAQRGGFLVESCFDFVSHQVRVQLAHDICFWRLRSSL